MFPAHGDNANDLLANADLAMYQAKDHGRGSWHLFSVEDGSRARLQERIYRKAQLEKALEEDRFLLHLQPIIEIEAGSIACYEVLLRMRGEDDKPIPPDKFIETAERSGLIHKVDRLVVTKTVRYMERLRRAGREVTFTVNLSGRAFDNWELLPFLDQLLRDSPIDPSHLILEITETAAIADFACARNLMLAIKALGCRFALDDFGAGFSSFYYLKEFPADFVKIDGAFVRQLPAHPDHQVLVKALNDVAQSFGKRTIAEYVEDADTLAILKEYGVDYAQGYFTGPPRPGEDWFGPLTGE
jgi:EAL domain-containing protein (putative c-di-GMP-specific phosphodiesterase class I)